jgi:hypothetical protein
MRRCSDRLFTAARCERRSVQSARPVTAINSISSRPIPPLREKVAQPRLRLNARQFQDSSRLSFASHCYRSRPPNRAYQQNRMSLTSPKSKSTLCLTAPRITRSFSWTFLGRDFSTIAYSGALRMSIACKATRRFAFGLRVESAAANRSYKTDVMFTVDEDLIQQHCGSKSPSCEARRCAAMNHLIYEVINFIRTWYVGKWFQTIKPMFEGRSPAGNPLSPVVNCLVTRLRPFRLHGDCELRAGEHQVGF